MHEVGPGWKRTEAWKPPLAKVVPPAERLDRARGRGNGRRGRLRPRRRSRTTLPRAPTARSLFRPVGRLGSPLTAAIATVRARSPTRSSTNPLTGPEPTPGANVTYTNNPDLPGDDSFTYRAFDGVDYSNTATVTIHIGTRASAAPAGACDGPDDERCRLALTLSPAPSFGESSLAFSEDTTYSVPLPPKEVVMHFDDDIAFDPSGLATCDASSILGTSTADAIAACPNARVGSGTATATTGSQHDPLRGHGVQRGALRREPSRSCFRSTGSSG